MGFTLFFFSSPSHWGQG